MECKLVHSKDFSSSVQSIVQYVEENELEKQGRTERYLVGGGGGGGGELKHWPCLFFPENVGDGDRRCHAKIKRPKKFVQTFFWIMGC